MNKGLTIAALIVILLAVTGREGSANKPCPPATQDPDLNARNRQSTKDNFMYGPMNEDPETYWARIAKKWNVPIAKAKTRLCGNCIAYDQSPRMKKCMDTDSTQVGYCHMHHFKCASYRTCSTWVEGGPIISDKKSYEWQK